MKPSAFELCQNLKPIAFFNSLAISSRSLRLVPEDCLNFL